MASLRRLWDAWSDEAAAAAELRAAQLREAAKWYSQSEHWRGYTDAWDDIRATVCAGCRARLPGQPIRPAP